MEVVGNAPQNQAHPIFPEHRKRLALSVSSLSLFILLEIHAEYFLLLSCTSFCSVLSSPSRYINPQWDLSLVISSIQEFSSLWPLPHCYMSLITCAFHGKYLSMKCGKESDLNTATQGFHKDMLNFCSFLLKVVPLFCNLIQSHINSLFSLSYF